MLPPCLPAPSAARSAAPSGASLTASAAACVSPSSRRTACPNPTPSSAGAPAPSSSPSRPTVHRGNDQSLIVEGDRAFGRLAYDRVTRHRLLRRLLGILGGVGFVAGMTPGVPTTSAAGLPP